MSKKKFLIDSLLNIVATAIPIIILQLVTLPIIGSQLGGDQYGLVVTLISLFTVLSFPFGNVLNNIRLLVDEEYSKKRISGDFNILLISSIMLSAIMMIVGTIYYEGKFSFVSIGLIILISCLNLVREYLGVSFRLQLNYKKIVINNVILTIGYVLGTFLFSLMGYWQFIFIFGYGFSVLYIIKNSTLLKEPVVLTELFHSTSYKSIVLLGSSLLTNVVNYADKLLIFPLLGPAAVTIYYTATIIGKIMSMAITPINGVILSYIARLEKFNQKTFGSIMLLTGIVGIIGYVFTIWISPFVLGFLYPDWATESMKYIYITTATAIVGVISSVIKPFILKFNHINWQLIINGSNVIVYIVCAFVLYQFYGLMGFCIGIFISSVYQLLLMICIFIVSNRENHEGNEMGEKLFKGWRLVRTQRLTHDHLETPYFLIDERELDSNLNQLEEALRKHWNHSIIGYSFKTNGLPWLLNYFKERGVYAEVVSDDEYELAKKLGYKKDKVIYNGVAKSKETFIEAIKNGCIVNVDSQRELDWLRELDQSSGETFEIGIRVNFDLESACPNETVMGAEGGRFGFCYENGDLKKAIDFVNALKNINLTGLHLHCSTKTRSLNIYRAISRVACEIAQNYSLFGLKYIDVGGGFFGGLKDKPQFDEYIEVISSELSKVFNKEDTVLIVEPGTSLASSPFSFVTSVVDVKLTSKNYFVTTDGSHININPLKNKGIKFFRVKYKGEAERQNIDKQVISGFTCMEDDRIMVLEGAPQLLVGDQVIYEKVGAYSMSLSPLFIKFFPAVYVEKDGVMMEVRERWTADQYL